ncbi:MAG: L-2-amino-thiazoline-4-carboxylic acid hydrolase [Anaerolineales bacterium]
MKPKQIRLIIARLSANIGRSWAIVLLRFLSRKGAALARTRWAHSRSAEAAFLRRIALAPVLYEELGSKFGKQKALTVMEDLLMAVGCSEQWDHLKSMPGRQSEGMQRLMAFHDLMDLKGAPQFNLREYVQQDDRVCHFVITRCVFHDFFTEAGAPELTSSFCQVDRRFFPEAFPDFSFHRGDSWENTIAYGKDHCEFVFEKKEI